jgi:hypothetical protein
VIIDPHFEKAQKIGADKAVNAYSRPLLKMGIENHGRDVVGLEVTQGQAP